MLITVIDMNMLRPDRNRCSRALNGRAGVAAGTLLILFLLLPDSMYHAAYALPAIHNGWSLENGALTEGGKPVFPVGVYYVSHFANEKARRLEDLSTIVAGGLNVIHTPIDSDDGPFLDACQRLGIEVIAEFNDDPDNLVRSFGQHPALRAWSTFDDVDAQNEILGTARYTSLEVFERTKYLHASSPGILTYISGGYPARLADYAQSADLIGLQMYPVPDESSSVVGQSLMVFQRRTGTAIPVVIANLQIFGWFGVKRPPDKPELRNMTYQALIGGAKGILYYTFFDKVTDQRKQPSLWNNLTGVVKELQNFKDFLLNGKHCIFQSSNPEAFAALWELPLATLFIAANGTASAITVDFSGCKLNDADSGSAWQTGRIKITGQQSNFQLEMQPLEVVIQSH